MKVFCLISLFLIALCSCQSTNSDLGNKNKGDEKQGEQLNRYAKGFRIIRHANYSHLQVLDPWQGSRNVSLNYYVLSDSSKNLPVLEKGTCIIKKPVRRIVCFSTTHVAMISSLGADSLIVGISGSAFVVNPNIRKRIEEGIVQDVGYDQSLNYELLVGLHPDLVIAYGVGAEVTGLVGRLKEWGIPVVVNSEYMEVHPLAKTEWIKFLAVFLGREKQADSIFHEVMVQYESLKTLVDSVVHRPVVMTGLPWKDSWNVPSDNSTTSGFIWDAGGSYLWKELSGQTNFSLSIEAVISRSKDADVWINAGIAERMEQITATDERLQNARPLRLQKVFNNNARMGPGGGNDFWESGVMNPHLILADLIFIFHPELLKNHRLMYYSQLK